MIALTLLWIAVRLGLAWFVILLCLFQPPLTRVPQLARICALGMVICGPAGYFNTYWLNALTSHLASAENHVLANALLWILVAPIEEMLKLTIVLSTVRGKPRIDHPRDACLLAACSALGFATYENYFYMSQVGESVIEVRGWLCTAGHMLWSSLWGYYLGLAWMGRAPMRLAIAEGVILASLAHGTYNFLCTNLNRGIAFLVPIASVVLLGQFFARRLWTGLHTPYIATLARGGVPLSRLHFPDASDKREQDLLKRMDDDDPQARTTAVSESASCETDAVYDAVRWLERDPERRVREAATKARIRLEKRLRAVGVTSPAG